MWKIAVLALILRIVRVLSVRKGFHCCQIRLALRIAPLGFFPLFLIMILVRFPVLVLHVRMVARLAILIHIAVHPVWKIRFCLRQHVLMIVLSIHLGLCMGTPPHENAHRQSIAVYVCRNSGRRMLVSVQQPTVAVSHSLPARSVTMTGSSIVPITTSTGLLTGYACRVQRKPRICGARPTRRRAHHAPSAAMATWPSARVPRTRMCRAQPPDPGTPRPLRLLRSPPRSQRRFLPCTWWRWSCKGSPSRSIFRSEAGPV